MLPPIFVKIFRPFIRALLPAAVGVLGLIFILHARAGIASAAEPAGQVTIIHDTHIHGRYYNPTKAVENIANLFGVANKIEQTKPNALYLANGDDIATSVISDVFYGKHIIDAFNQSTVDYDTFGNHDWDYGTDVLRQRISESRFPWVTTNVIDTRTNDIFGKEQGTKRYVIKEVNGVKVGITGLGIKGAFMDSTVTVVNPVTAMQQVIPLMKADGADIIVVISHLARKDAEILAAKVNGIAVLVGDHSENVLDQPEQINGTILSFRGCEFQYVGELTLQVSGGKLASFQYVRHAVADEASQPGFAPDPEVKQVMDSYLSQLNVVIGKNSVPLETRSSVIRKAESNFGNYVADVMRAWQNSDAALFNAGYLYTNKLYAPGDITKRMVIDLLPNTFQLVTLQVTGQQLLDALENGVSKVESADRRFPQVSGIRFAYDSTKPAGSRILSVTVGGQPLDLAKTYTLTTTDYLAAGHEGYTVFKQGRLLTNPELGPLQTTLVSNQIQKDGTIAPAVEGRITAGNAIAPVTTISVDPAAPNGSNGWYSQPVSFTLSASSASGVSKTEYRIDGGTWQAYTAAVTISADGSHTIEYRSIDTSGNVETAKSQVVKLDAKAPTTTAVLDPASAGKPYTGSVKLTLTAADATSGVSKLEYRVNNGAWNVYSGPVTYSDNGSYTVEYRSTDAAGNLEKVSFVSFSVAVPATPDTTAPVTTAALDPAPTGSPYSGNVTLTLSATDDKSGVARTEYRVNGGAWTPYANALVFSANGPYLIEYFSTDAAGNAEALKSVSFSISKSTATDTTAPVTTLATDPALPPGGWYSTDVGVTLSATDDLSGVAKTEYRINAGSWVVYSGKFTVSKEGSTVIDYRSTDRSGNVETFQTMTVKLDKTLPVTTYKFNSAPTGTNGWYKTKVYFYLYPNDNLSGVAKTEYRVNGGAWTPYTTTVTFATDGMFAIEYRTIDTAGNIQQVSLPSLNIDKAAPVTAAQVSPGTNGGSTLTLTASDVVSGVSSMEYRVNAGAWTPYTTPVNFTEKGTYSVEYHSTDQAGNVEAAKTKSITVS